MSLFGSRCRCGTWVVSENDDHGCYGAIWLYRVSRGDIDISLIKHSMRYVWSEYFCSVSWFLEFGQTYMKHNEIWNLLKDILNLRIFVICLRINKTE